jgi:peroxiredoxin (alkyl hydroperoxide reductase subunit C)
MQPLLLVLTLLLVFNQAAVSAQMGPKEEVKQPATDLDRVLDRVKVGQPAPEFTLEDSEGKNVSLADYRGKKNVVLVFIAAIGDPIASRSSASCKACSTNKIVRNRKFSQ